MNLERAIGQQAPTRRQWRQWACHEPKLGVLSYVHLRAELRRGPQDRQDELLATLVRIAQRDKEAAGVAVACLMPGLRALVARHAPGLDHAEALAIAVEGLCEAIVRFAGEPPFVASQLLRLPKYRLQRAVRTEVVWRRHSRDLPAGAGSGVPTDVGTAVCLRLDVHAGLLSPTEAWLIHATRVVGHSLKYAARRLDITYEAAKKRRQRAETRWTAQWATTRRQADVTQVAQIPPPQEVA